MSSTGDFDQFYHEHLASLLQPLEEQRKKASLFGSWGSGAMAVSLISYIIASAGEVPAAGIVAFTMLPVAVTLLIIFYKKKKNYSTCFKEKIIARIIEFIDPGLSYKPHACIHKSDYINSGLYPGTPDCYSGDDYAEGMRDKTFFCFSELHTQKKAGSGKTTHWKTTFKGLFFIGDFNKHFHGRTFVYSEHNPQISFFTKLFSSFAWNLEKVKLESPEFEDKFIVYSSDQVEARYILTPSFMERLLKLQKLTGDKTSYSFVDSKIHVAVPVQHDLFEPVIFSTNNYDRLAGYCNTVRMVFDIIDELNLNLRIWNKE